MSGEKNVPEKIHAELGASVASRWMACPGSIRLSREVPTPPQTEYALEGTRAHAVAELCLSKGVDPDVYEGMEIEGGIVDADMVEHVRVFVDYCRELMQKSSGYWVERKFNLASLNPPGPMFGTSDFMAYDAVTRTLDVPDFKYGRGVVVEAKGNKQLRYYGLGGALSLDLTQYPVERVRLTIVQPRAMHPDGAIRTEEISFIELIEFAADLMVAARRTTEPDAPLAAGDHCLFCPAGGVCPEQRKQALEVARSEFSVEAPFLPPAPETIPEDQFVDMLSKLPILENWAAAMRATAFARLERGESVPGFKLVEKRPTRQWRNEGDVQQLLKATGYDEDEILKPRDLKSVAQIEKLVGKKDFAASQLAGAVVKVSSGYNMVAANDPRPAVQLTAGEEFLLLPPGAGPSTEGPEN